MSCVSHTRSSIAYKAYNVLQQQCNHKYATTNTVIQLNNLFNRLNINNNNSKQCTTICNNTNYSAIYKQHRCLSSDTNSNNDDIDTQHQELPFTTTTSSIDNTSNTTSTSEQPQPQSTTHRRTASHYRTSYNKKAEKKPFELQSPLSSPDQSTAQTFNDVETVFSNARLVVEEYRKRIDRDVDERGNKPKTIREWINKLRNENKIKKTDYTNDDYDTSDMKLKKSGYLTRGKSLQTERIIQRLRQEESLQERLSFLETFGRPDPVMLDRYKNIDRYARAYGLGKRKSSIAQVWIKYNKFNQGDIIINNIRYIDYFNRYTDRDRVVKPLILCDVLGQFDVVIKVSGGGTTGQSDAIKLGISRALVNYEPLLRETLKDNFLLTRDKRVVERKKFGRYKARKGFAFVKR